MHKLDLLYMLHNKLYGKTYKYIPTGINLAWRYKVTRLLKAKKAADVAEMIKDIYKAGSLRYSKVLQCDNGSIFMSYVAKLLEGKGLQDRLFKWTRVANGGY